MINVWQFTTTSLDYQVMHFTCLPSAGISNPTRWLCDIGAWPLPQSFEKAQATLSFRCAPAYAISTWKNIANKTDASPGVFLCGNQIWIHSMGSVLPRARAALCAVSNKGCIWVMKVVLCMGRCQVCSTWGARGCVGCCWPGAPGALGRAAPAVLEGKRFLFPECSHMAFMHSGACGWIRSVPLFFSLKSPLFLFKYFQSSHPLTLWHIGEDKRDETLFLSMP